MEPILQDLNPQQKQAVSAGEGQILVLAGPGSGKTRVLTRRIAYLIGTAGVHPYNILAVTFTNKAAREMENRVANLLGGSLPGMMLGTFHGICARILRREAELLPFKSNFVIFDSDDQETLVKRVIREMNLNEKLYRPTGIHSAISKVKNEMIWPETFPIQNYRDEVVARIYKRYQELLVANNAVDFDDLLLWVVRLFEDNPTVREHWAQRFQHVLVDEFQDTNQVQYTLLRHMASVHHNIFVVGDEDQSIYRWRGADYRNMLRFEQDYPERQKILLEQNYRSTQTVLDAARAVIDQNAHRTPKRLFSDRGMGDKISLHEAGDDYAEAAFVLDTIQRQLDGKLAKGSDFAIMYRTNAQSRLLEEAFLRSGLPYRLVGAQRFYGRREVKDIIAYLRLVHNPADEVSLNRAINTPPRGIGDKTMLALQMRARQAGVSAGELLLDLARGAESPHWSAFSGRGAALLADFGGLLISWRAAHQTVSLPDLFSRIVADINYREYIDDGSEEGTDRWSNVEELKRIAFEFQERGMDEFLENLALISDQDTLPEGVNATTLLTLHAAKGLEYPQVFIVGLDDGILPHSRSFDEPEEMAEERRLLYVGMTRAKDHLYLVRADQRGLHGAPEEAIASRFLQDIPQQLLSGTRRGRRSGGRASQSYTTWSLPAPRGSSFTPRPVQPAVVQRYSANMRVSHPSWGEGLVVDSRIQDDDEVVDVFFDTVGFKRVVASLARLEILV
ncbi:MAG: UvrD-helicase domain-containing protein [Anaerolineaceae bacterium]|nr:UvrD-helicase domain-containing protein [Anaerolineaceae bacterium]